MSKQRSTQVIIGPLTVEDESAQDEVKRLARALVPKTMARLAALIADTDTPPNAVIQAAALILNRAAGTPAQEMTVRQETLDVTRLHLEAFKALREERAMARAVPVSPAQLVVGSRASGTQGKNHANDT